MKFILKKFYILPIVLAVIFVFCLSNLYAFKNFIRSTSTTYAKDEFIETYQFTPTDKDIKSQFGFSVSASENHIIVGSPCDTKKGKCAGAAYIYKLDKNKWGLQQKLTADEAHDWFGHSVSTNGNYAVVGSFNRCDYTTKGFVHVFKFDGTNWVLDTKITSENTDDWFGYAVCVYDKYIIIGAPKDNTHAKDSGAIYIYKLQNNKWIKETKTTAGDVKARAGFGYTISIADNNFLVGAPWKEENKKESNGAAYTFKYNVDHWELDQKITPDDPFHHKLFGSSVAIYSDTIFVGAIGDSAMAQQAGSVYAYEFDGKTWNNKQKLTADESTPDAAFGRSVSIYDNFAVVGADLDTNATKLFAGAA